MFVLDNVCKGHTLAVVTLAVMDRMGPTRHFKLPRRKLMNFLIVSAARGFSWRHPTHGGGERVVIIDGDGFQHLTFGRYDTCPPRPLTQSQAATLFFLAQELEGRYHPNRCVTHLPSIQPPTHTAGDT